MAHHWLVGFQNGWSVVIGMHMAILSAIFNARFSEIRVLWIHMLLDSLYTLLGFCKCFICTFSQHQYLS